MYIRYMYNGASSTIQYISILALLSQRCLFGYNCVEKQWRDFFRFVRKLLVLLRLSEEQLRYGEGIKRLLFPKARV